MKRFIVAVLVAGGLCAGVGFGQVEVEWERTFGGRGIEESSAIIKTVEGGFAVVGRRSLGLDHNSYWLVSFNLEGDTLWSQTYSGIENSNPYGLIQTTDGGFALAGMTDMLVNGNLDFWLVKTNDVGDSLWSQNFGGRENDEAQTLIQTQDGGFALVGYTTSFGSGGSDIWFLKTNSDGDSLWSNTYGGNDTECAMDIIELEDGGFMLCGYTLSFGSGSDFWMVRTNSEGDSLWSRTFGGEIYEYAKDVVLTMDGGFTVVGWTNSFGSGNGDIWLLGLNQNADSLWSNSYGGLSNETPNSIIQLDDGGYAISCGTGSFGEGEWDCWLLRTSGEGDSLWSTIFGGRHDESSSGLIQANDGGFIVAGTTESIGAGLDDFYIVKTTPDPVSVRNPSVSLAPSTVSLLSAYPNPFNSSLNISFQSPRFGRVALELIDPNGRKVASLFDGFAPPGERRIVWNAGQMPAGSYFVRVVSSNQIGFQKISLVK